MRKFTELLRLAGFWLSRRVNYPFVGPQTVQFSLTSRCNLRCKMCNIAGRQPEEEELSTSCIKRLMDQAAQWGVREVLFTGGEPFLRNDIYELCSYASEKGLRSVITTNGTLLDEAACRRLADCGAGHLHFSLDGLENTHDSLRGKGVFSAVVKAFGLLQSERRRGASFSLGAAFTVMDVNAGELCGFMRLCAESGVDVVNFQPFTPDNADFSGEDPMAGLWPSIEKIALLREQIALLGEMSINKPAILQEPSLELLPEYYAGTLKPEDWVCFGGFKTAFICYSKGKPLLYTCHGICGDLDTVPLREAWVSSEAYRLRLHSRSCKKPCLQSCYSLSAASSMPAMWRKCLKGKAV